MLDSIVSDTEYTIGRKEAKLANYSSFDKVLGC